MQQWRQRENSGRAKSDLTGFYSETVNGAIELQQSNLECTKVTELK